MLTALILALVVLGGSPAAPAGLPPPIGVYGPRFGGDPGGEQFVSHCLDGQHPCAAAMPGGKPEAGRGAAAPAGGAGQRAKAKVHHGLRLP